MPKDKMKFKELVDEYFVTALDVKLALIRASLLDKKYEAARDHWSKLLNELEDLQKASELSDAYE